MATFTFNLDDNQRDTMNAIKEHYGAPMTYQITQAIEAYLLQAREKYPLAFADRPGETQSDAN